MSWIELLRDVGLFGILSFSIQKIIESSNSKSIEKYKQELDFASRNYQINLDSHLEKHKSELSINERKQNLLLEKRIVVIDEIYKRVSQLNFAMISLIQVHLTVQDGEAEQKERYKLCSEKFEQFNQFYLLNKIYFNTQTIVHMDRVRKEYVSAQWDFFELIRLEPLNNDGQITQEDKTRAYETVKNASLRIREYIPKILEDLENEFRDLLGVS